MDKKTFRIRGLGLGLDGLYVEAAKLGGDYELNDVLRDLHCVTRLSNLNIMVGDRNLSIQLPQGSLYIESKYLEETTETAVREFDSSSQFGVFKEHKVWSGSNIVFNAVLFSDAISVNAAKIEQSESKTVLSFYLFKDLERCWKEILELSKRMNQDNVVFELDAMRDWETDEKE